MRRRNPRRAYDEHGREIPPPTIGELRAEGDRTAAVTYHGCGHHAIIAPLLCHPSLACYRNALPCDEPAVVRNTGVLDREGARDDGAATDQFSGLAL
jgi:hypothetical protein